MRHVNIAAHPSVIAKNEYPAIRREILDTCGVAHVIVGAQSS
jgi:hypothetical protein